ncbi:hypothetical protein HAX54_030232 [Datura stramonium]|uniref:Uncharacterized protein n=1 Tax=Datura stramonium TaxID=4076 RepID=A0ABS8SAS1_DATST|nr:hypothetical protein [Datura stramonium]
MESLAAQEAAKLDPSNEIITILSLIKGAACRFKLGQFEKAVEDCTAALVLRPSYTKARFRRADCYMKLERWEAAIQEFEMLLQEKQGDEEVKRALLDAKIQLERERDEDQKQRMLCNGSSNLVLVSSN